MSYIKFDTITSTNDFLKSYAGTHKPENFFYVYADYQSKGRGQHSNIWQSECCKNILMSIFLKPALSPEQQNLLNKIVSLSIVKVLQKFNIPGVRIKLPNDIMADAKKIAGILIENKIHGNKWQQSIIGIGLNVNQTDFVNLPTAISMKNLTGKTYDREQIMKLLIEQLRFHYGMSAEELEKEFNKWLITNGK